MDQGHGLLDRTNIIVPNCLRPTPYEMKEAIEKCETYNIKSIEGIMYEMYCTNLPKVFTFDAIAKEYLDELNEEYILEMNSALLSGEIPPKSIYQKYLLLMQLPKNT